MKLVGESFLEIKKSKFYGLLYEINSIEEVNEILENLRREHKKARHFPYAYKINNTAKKTDDKEPSGTCGTPLLNVLERNNLNNHLIIVIRYFGGVKLGAGPLLRSYSKTANEVMTNIRIVITDNNNPFKYPLDSLCLPKIKPIINIKIAPIIIIIILLVFSFNKLNIVKNIGIITIELKNIINDLIYLKKVFIS